jgi:benzoyl-CoA reductase/2-hydroxyglutaryl-CoA dehydratase subunit BcrC/BadD/HgdB
MKPILSTSPFVPPEWIAAHGLRPGWTRPGSAVGSPLREVRRGVCPYAGAWVDAARSGVGATAVVAATTCDQMRYAAALLDRDAGVPVFLMNVPSTWQTLVARQLYRDELERLGRFLVRVGGTAPSASELVRVMLQYDRARSAVRAVRDRLPARRFAEAVVRLRGSDGNEGSGLSSGSRTVLSETSLPEDGSYPISPGVALALVGGPLSEEDFALLDLIDQAGGRVVLDATEGGERTLPAPFDRDLLREDPLDALVRAYFDAIPDAFRRPNHGLYEWLGRELAGRGVRGIVLRRYLWCDTWHAELNRLRRRSPVPVLDLQVGDRDDRAMTRMLGRLEAFLETLS